MSREQFETFAADYESNFTRNEDDAGDEYANCTLQVMWETWQACELSLKQQRAELLEVLDKLARLGNEPLFGNSIGNKIALDAILKAQGYKT